MMSRCKRCCCYVVVVCQLLLGGGCPAFFTLSSVAAAIDSDDAGYDASTTSGDNDDGSDLIQENPDYVPTEKRGGDGGDSDDHSDDHSDDDNDSDDDEDVEDNTAEDGADTAVDKHEKKETKSAIGKLLGRSRKTPRLIRKPVKLIKQHKMKIVAAVVLYAFRRELLYFAWRLVSKPYHDSATGESGRKLVPFDTTSILKMIIFIEVMRRIVTSSNGAGDADESGDRQSPSPSLLRLLLLGTGTNPALLILLSKFLAPSNTAYIPPIEQHYSFERINDRHKKDGMALQKAIDPSAAVGPRRKVSLAPSGASGEQTNSTTTAATKASAALHSLLPRSTQQKVATSPAYNSTVILFDMTGLGSKLHDMGRIRDQVSFLLSEYGIPQIVQPSATAKNPNNDGGGGSGNETESSVEEAEVEVVVLLESPGGSAPDYALAAQQVLRLRNEGLKVTVVVDKVAASGGYMIACASSPGRLFAGPFAVLGSIGVVGQTVNIHNVLEGWGVKPLVFRGGKDKAPVGLIGEVTDEGIATVQSMVESTHRAFKRHVASARPIVRDTIDELATGDTWIGYDALDVGLIDRIITSDEYVSERMKEGARVLKLVQTVAPKFPFASPTTLAGPRPAIALVSVGKAIGLSVLSELQQLLELASRLLTGLLPEAGNGGILPMAKVAADVSTSAKHSNS